MIVFLVIVFYGLSTITHSDIQSISQEIYARKYFYALDKKLS